MNINELYASAITTTCKCLGFTFKSLFLGKSLVLMVSHVCEPVSRDGVIRPVTDFFRCLHGRVQGIVHLDPQRSAKSIEHMRLSHQNGHCSRGKTVE